MMSSVSLDRRAGFGDRREVVNPSWHGNDGGLTRGESHAGATLPKASAASENSHTNSPAREPRAQHPRTVLQPRLLLDGPAGGWNKVIVDVVMEQFRRMGTNVDKLGKQLDATGSDLGMMKSLIRTSAEEQRLFAEREQRLADLLSTLMGLLQVLAGTSLMPATPPRRQQSQRQETDGDNVINSRQEAPSSSGKDQGAFEFSHNAVSDAVSPPFPASDFGPKLPPRSCDTSLPWRETSEPLIALDGQRRQESCRANTASSNASLNETDRMHADAPQAVLHRDDSLLVDQGSSQSKAVRSHAVRAMRRAAVVMEAVSRFSRRPGTCPPRLQKAPMRQDISVQPRLLINDFVERHISPLADIPIRTTLDPPHESWPPSPSSMGGGDDSQDKLDYPFFPGPFGEIPPQESVETFAPISPSVGAGGHSNSSEVTLASGACSTTTQAVNVERSCNAALVTEEIQAASADENSGVSEPKSPTRRNHVAPKKSAGPKLGSAPRKLPSSPKSNSLSTPSMGPPPLASDRLRSKTFFT